MGEKLIGRPELDFKITLKLKRLNSPFYIPKSLDVDVSARACWQGIQLVIGDPFDIRVRADNMDTVLSVLCRPIEMLRVIGEQERLIPADISLTPKAQDILTLTKTSSWDKAEGEYKTKVAAWLKKVEEYDRSY